MKGGSPVGWVEFTKISQTGGKGKIIVEKSGNITIKGTEFEFTASDPMKINAA